MLRLPEICFMDSNELKKHRHRVGLVIAAARSRKGVNQEWLADKLNLSQSAYSRIESGDRSLRSDELLEVCYHLSINPEELLCADDMVLAEPRENYAARAQSVKPKPRLKLVIEFGEDDTMPDGPLVRKLNEVVRMINEQE